MDAAADFERRVAEGWNVDSRSVPRDRGDDEAATSLPARQAVAMPPAKGLNRSGARSRSTTMRRRRDDRENPRKRRPSMDCAPCRRASGRSSGFALRRRCCDKATGDSPTLGEDIRSIRRPHRRHGFGRSAIRPEHATTCAQSSILSAICVRAASSLWMGVSHDPPLLFGLAWPAWISLAGRGFARRNFRLAAKKPAVLFLRAMGCAAQRQIPAARRRPSL